MSDSFALAKIHAVVLVFIIIISGLVAVAYILLDGQEESSETMKIGVCADLDSSAGRSIFQEAVLAVEHINAEGGLLGRSFEVVAEDDDSESGNMDVALATNALTKLITVDQADYIVSTGTFTSIYQELAFQHKKILFDAYNSLDESTQKVLDDYNRYKYYFRIGTGNATAITNNGNGIFVNLVEDTGFNKVALVSNEFHGSQMVFSGMTASLQESGIEVVYTASIPWDTLDFSSYFAQAEAAGTEIMYCLNIMPEAGLPFVREYYERQSPMVLMGNIGGIIQSDFWELTEGKCEFVIFYAGPTTAGYPFTNKTLAFTEAYTDRWGEVALGPVYDAVRYILPDAIRRAGTFETDAVISALETVDVETSLARHFVFTSSHDIMLGGAGPNKHFFFGMFQWQDGEMVPVLPKERMEEAGATLTFPDWPGPWDEK